MFKKLSILLVTVCLLSACKDPAEEIDGMIEEGNLIEAAEWMDEELEDDPKDPLFNGLAAEVKTRMCLKEKCTETNPQLLKQIGQHLSHVKKPIKTDSGQLRDVYLNLIRIAKGFEKDETHPKPIIEFIKIVPPYVSHIKFPNLLMDMAIESMRKVDVPATVALLSLVKEIAPSSYFSVYTPLLVAMISHNEDEFHEAMELTKQPDAQMTKEVAYLMPYALLFEGIEEDVDNGAFAFIKTLSTSLKALGLSKENYTAVHTGTSIALRDMAMNDKILALGAKHINSMKPVTQKHIWESSVANEPTETTPEPTPATEIVQKVETPTATEELALNDQAKKDMFKLYLLKTSLTFNPDQKDVWKAFLQPAMNYVDRTGMVEILFSGIDQNKIPKDEISTYNSKLFTVIRSRFNKNEDSVELLKKVVVPPVNNADIIAQLDELVNMGLDKAIKHADYITLVDYASFKPELAKPYRQKIVELVVDSLDRLWTDDKFEEMAKLGNFLQTSMNIDFNLDSLLLKKFQEYVDKHKIIDQLSSETIAPLFKQQTEEQLDFGAKYAYLKEHFMDHPEVLDSQLKSLILNAKGMYGIPVAFFRLYHMFIDPKFTTEKRNEFLVGAIKDSLEKNSKLTAIETIKMGSELIDHHPDIPPIFIVNETLKRIKTLDESKEVWRLANKPIKESIKNVKPQFTTLMEAIELFDSGKKKESFDKFSVLSDEKYIQTASDYLTKFRKIVGDHKGVFVAETVDEKMHSAVIVVEPTADADAITTLLNVKVRLTNNVGSILIKSDSELTEDYGRTFSYTFNGQTNPDLNILPLTEEQRASATLPQSFERTFGEIIGVKFDYDEAGNDIVLAVISDGTTYPFHRVTSNIDLPLFPQGKFGITDQISVKNKNTDHVMPVGSILQFDTNEKRPIQPMHAGKKLAIVYPVTGTLLHPSSPIPRQFSGFFSPDTYIVDFEFDYPLSQNSKGTIQSVSRCQVLDNMITCASHNKHWSRLKYSHIVKGYKVAGTDTAFKMAPVGDDKDILQPPAAK